MRSLELVDVDHSQPMFTRLFPNVSWFLFCSVFLRCALRFYRLVFELMGLSEEILHHYGVKIP